MLTSVINNLKSPTSPELARLRRRGLEAILQENFCLCAANAAARESLEESMGISTPVERPSSSFILTREIEESRTGSSFRKFFTRG